MASYSATFEPTTGPFASHVYVNSAWANVPVGTDPDGAGPATAMGFDAFADVQSGINATTAGGTLTVDAGTYSHFTVNNSITITGAGAGSTFITGASPALTVSAGTTTLSGMTFTNAVDSQPVVLVNGSGSLNLTTSTINGSFSNQSLVQANTTGSLDLGDTTTIGSNIFNISGGANTTGNAYIDDIASTSFSAVGDIWDTDATAGTSYIDFNTTPSKTSPICQRPRSNQMLARSSTGFLMSLT